MAPQMPQILAPNVRVLVQPLDAAAFASFGTVIQNPEHSPAAALVHHHVISANQGSALKYIDVSHLTNHYNLAPSRKPAKAVVNMFVCSPRTLTKASSSSSSSDNDGVNVTAESYDQPAFFPVHILERHPFTPQTFIPTGLSVNDTTTRYLVIVAPTLPVSSGRGTDKTPPYPLQTPRRRRSIVEIFSKARPSAFTNAQEPPSSFSSSSGAPASPKPKGPGKPDLSQIKAFIADGSQSVTYGPGTWHAPMVVLGAKSIDFVVVQYANGVALEDCQEIAINPGNGTQGINVVIDNTVFDQTIKEKAKL